MRLLNARGRGHQLHLAGMPGRLLLDRVNQLQRAPRIVSLVRLRFHPDGEELRSQVSLFSRIQVELPAFERIAQVELLIEEPLRRIRMRIDHNRRGVDLCGVLAGCRARFFCHRLCRLRCRLGMRRRS